MTSEVLAELSEAHNLRLMVLKGMTEAAHDHASAILRLSEEEHTRSAKVLLRTLIEGSITAGYVMAQDNDRRAAAYVLKSPSEALRLLRRLLRLVQEKPGEERRILASAGLSSLDELKQRITRLEADTDHSRQERGLPSFPNVADCAKAVGLDVELAYANVYAYLLSQQVHSRAGDTLRGVLTQAREADDLEKVLRTTLYLLVHMLGMTSQHFGRPERESLLRFQTLLHDLQSPQP